MNKKGLTVTGVGLVLIVIIVVIFSAQMMAISRENQQMKTNLEGVISNNIKNAYMQLRTQIIVEQANNQQYNPTELDNIATLANTYITALDFTASENLIQTNKTVSKAGIKTAGTKFTRTTWHNGNYYVIVAQGDNYNVDGTTYITTYAYLQGLKNSIGMTIKFNRNICTIVNSCFDSSVSDIAVNPFSTYRGQTGGLGIQI